MKGIISGVVTLPWEEIWSQDVKIHIGCPWVFCVGVEITPCCLCCTTFMCPYIQTFSALTKTVLCTIGTALLTHDRTVQVTAVKLTFGMLETTSYMIPLLYRKSCKIMYGIISRYCLKMKMGKEDNKKKSRSTSNQMHLKLIYIQVFNAACCTLKTHLK